MRAARRKHWDRAERYFGLAIDDAERSG